VVALPATAFAQGREVSKEVFDKLGPAQEALKKGDHGTALRLAKEAQNVAKSAYEREVSIKVQIAAAYGARDYPAAIGAIDALIGGGALGPAEKADFRRRQAQLYEQTRQYDKAVLATQEAMKSGATAKDYELLYRMYGTRGDCANSLEALDKLLAGRAADEKQLKWRNSCYYKAKNPKRVDVVEELVRRFPKKEYFTDLTGLYREAKLDSRTMLNVYRWGFEKDLLERDVDYVAYADEALNAGGENEALKALEKAVAKKLLNTADQSSRSVRLLGSTRTMAADEKTRIEQLDKEARAGRNGESDASVAIAYYGLGEYAKAVEAAQRALQPDRVGRVKRVDDVNMLLGIALTKIKKTADASRAFEAAKADPRMTKAATLWLGR
jgi:tetratricopeptide (TPR) repeat protein